MEEKTYRCDKELEILILKQGWVETTNPTDRQKGKKEFRKTKNGRIRVRFDYINLVVYENHLGCNGITGTQIKADDLRLLFWYINSNVADRETISDGHFNLIKARDFHNTINQFLRLSKEFNANSRESRKYERLIENYQSCLIN